MAESQATAPTPSGPIFGAKPAEYYSLPSTFRRHHRLLTFVGALIIFFTFLVKEGLRDELRDTEGNIERAMQSFSANIAVINVSKQIIVVEEMISDTQVNKDSKQDQYLKQSLTNRSLLIETHIANMSWLLATLPEEYMNHLAQLYGELQADSTNFREKVNNLSDVEVAAQEEQLSNEYESLRTRVNDSISLIEKTAAEAKADKRSQYEAATWISYFLYVLGWGLALVGRLVGVGDVGED